jgi:hypothetical protein
VLRVQYVDCTVSFELQVISFISLFFLYFCGLVKIIVILSHKQHVKSRNNSIETIDENPTGYSKLLSLFLFQVLLPIAEEHTDNEKLHFHKIIDLKHPRCGIAQDLQSATLPLPSECMGGPYMVKL